MTAILLDHPADWIGVPETWPNERWSLPAEWIADLLDELVEAHGEEWGPLADEQREVLTAFIVGVVDLARAHGARAYLWLDGWEGYVNLAELMLIGVDLGDLTVREIAGDPTGAVAAPIVQDFVTASGLEGVVAVRYEHVESFGGVMARADYLWPVEEGVLRLFTSSADLVSFQRVLPHLEQLAATVTVDRGL